MEKIAQLWKVNQFMTKLNSPQSTNLQAFYIRSCKKLSKGISLPSQNFGPATMCSYCGSLWCTMDYKVRIIRGKKPSKSTKKIVRAMDTSKNKIPKIRATLGKKCARSQMNQIAIKCSVCLKRTKLSFVKPKREEAPKLDNVNSALKRKKKRVKDRTAGLNISGTPKLDVGNSTDGRQVENNRRSGYNNIFITPTPKLKKLNVNRLKDIVKKSVTPQKTKSLHSFLKGLS